MKLVFNYFFEVEMKIDQNLQNNDLLEWIYLIICQVFQIDLFNAFHYFHILLQTEKETDMTKFNETHIKFLILIYHLGSKITENREQTCLIKEIHNSLKTNEKIDFLESANKNKFGAFLIKTNDFLTLIEWFNDSTEAFLKNFNEGSLQSKEKLSYDLNFLNILIKVLLIFSKYFKFSLDFY